MSKRLTILISLLLCLGGCSRSGDTGRGTSSVTEPAAAVSAFAGETAPEQTPTPDPEALGLYPAETSSEAAGASLTEQTPTPDPEALGLYPEEGFPLLVNAQNPLPSDYDPQPLWVDQLPYPFSAYGMPALLDMVQAAAGDGVSLVLISGYRSVESQTRNFNAKIQEYLQLGYDQPQAEAATARYIAYPGTSEHNLGLAADFNSLYDSFEDTPEFAWLSENAWRYGFILRYPKDKEHLTGIAYEPWHYRYVGSNHAAVIWQEGLCLEEYHDLYGS